MLLYLYTILYLLHVQIVPYDSVRCYSTPFEAASATRRPVPPRLRDGSQMARFDRLNRTYKDLDLVSASPPPPADFFSPLVSHRRRSLSPPLSATPAIAHSDRSSSSGAGLGAPRAPEEAHRTGQSSS
jgi:hypothetical protein